MDVRLNVLVVSDSDMVRALASVAVGSSADLAASFAVSRGEALLALGSGCFDLLVLDWRLPAASVIAAAARNAGVPFMTVNDDDLSALRGGAFACVPCPFTSRTIAGALEAGLPSRV